MKRQLKTSPSNDDISAAFDKARSGNAIPLARLIKMFSIDDLAKGLVAANRYAIGPVSFHGLHLALCNAAGRKDERDHNRALVRVLRSQRRSMHVEASAHALRAHFETASRKAVP